MKLEDTARILCPDTIEDLKSFSLEGISAEFSAKAPDVVELKLQQT